MAHPGLQQRLLHCAITAAAVAVMEPTAAAYGTALPLHLLAAHCTGVTNAIVALVVHHVMRATAAVVMLTTQCEIDACAFTIAHPHQLRITLRLLSQQKQTLWFWALSGVPVGVAFANTICTFSAVAAPATAACPSCTMRRQLTRRQ